MDLDQRNEAEQLYGAAVGPKADYYVPRFIGFDTYDSNRISWNWPAFFCTFAWMLYRRMYGYAAVYFVLVPMVAWILFRLIAGVVPPELAPTFALLLLAFVFFIAPPLYANAMYHTTIADRIYKARDRWPTLDEQVQVLGYQRSTNPIACFAGAVLAISSSSWSWYQRDVEAVQQQVEDAIAHTGYIQADLEQFYRQQGARWPRDAAELNLDALAPGDFVESVEVRDGDIRVVLGGQSAPKMHGRLLVMKPFIAEPFRVDWVCVEHAEGQEAVPKRYWPRNCDTRDIKVSVSETSVSRPQKLFKFASGKATIPLPDTFTVSTAEDTLTATFGASQDHKIEVTLLRQLGKAVDKDLAVQFVQSSVSRAGMSLKQSEHRAILSEPGDDIEIQGRSYEVTHWVIGADNCVFTMTLTAPLPLTNDHRAFYSDLDSIQDKLACIST